MRKKIFFAVFSVLLLTPEVFAQEALPPQDYVASGDELIAQNDLARAEVDFNKALELDEANTAALLGLGKVYMYLGRDEEARTAFDKVLEKEPGNVDAHLLLARLYSWQGDYAQAIATYKNTLELDDSNVEARAGLAQVYNWADYRKQSVEQYRRILREDPRNETAYKGLAQVYVWDDRLKDAARIYRASVDLWPDNMGLRLSLAKVYGWMADYSSARGEYDDILAIEPDNAAAKEGKLEAEIALLPQHDFIFNYIRESDSDDWKARSSTWGYKHTRFFDYGQNIYAAYYYNELEETGKDGVCGNIAELGGRYNANDILSFWGSADFRKYNRDVDFFGGGEINALLNYHGKNTLSFRYAREFFDVLDETYLNSYGVESNLHLSPFLFFTDSFTYQDISDGNESDDTYHGLTVSLLKNEPDLNVSFGWRHRNFNSYSAGYYSPQDLDSWVYSVFLGQTFEKITPYAFFKFIDNSDGIDNYYYLAGADYRFSDYFSLESEVSYFDTTADYDALTVSLTCKFKF